MYGWRDGLGPWTPVVEDDRLYGRGGADDGYAAFASLTAIEAVQQAGGSHTRCVVLIEASEESGSPDLPAHLEALAGRLGTPSLVLCLDSGCNDYDRLWVTTSLRGLAGGTLVVDILDEGVHSGAASGVVPEHVPHRPPAAGARRGRHHRRDPPGRAARRHPGRPPAPGRRHRGRHAARTPTGSTSSPAPARSSLDPVEQILNHTWRPTLSVVGADGLPPTTRAGNVLRPDAPRCSCRSACRRPATPTPRSPRSAPRSPPIRPTAPG